MRKQKLIKILEVMPKNNTITTDYCTIENLYDEFFHVHYTTAELLLEDYISLIDIAKSKIKEYGKPYLLFTQTEDFSIEEKTWDYMKEHADKYDFMMANAIVITSLPVRLMAQLFMMFSKNATPTKVFSSETSALDWLKYLKELNSQKVM